MARYSTTSKWDVHKIRTAAEKYFGAEGLGLEKSASDECCLSFSGAGGYVSIIVKESSPHTQVVLDVSEWDAHIPAFLRQIS